MEHSVRTAHGTSSYSIKNETDIPWTGVCQGSAAAGPTWMAVEQLIIKTFVKECKGVKIQDPSGIHRYRSE